MALGSGVVHPVQQFDLAERRAELQRRRRRVRMREWLGVVVVALLAMWLASAALVALMAR